VSITYDRYQVIDYSVPVYPVEYGHMSHEPKAIDPFKNVVLPFDNLVWIFTVSTVVVVGITFAVFYVSYARFGEQALTPYTHPLDFVLLPLGMLMMQDRVSWFKHFPKSSAGALLVITWSVGCLILVLAYTSNLRASLIAVEYEKPTDTVQVCILVRVAALNAQFCNI
jgi:hypothetical protein